MTTAEQIQKNLAMIRNLKMTEAEMAELKNALAFSETGLFVSSSFFTNTTGLFSSFSREIIGPIIVVLFAIVEVFCFWC